MPFVHCSVSDIDVAQDEESGLGAPATEWSTHMVRGTWHCKNHGIYHYGLPPPLLDHLRRARNPAWQSITLVSSPYCLLWNYDRIWNSAFFFTFSSQFVWLVFSDKGNLGNWHWSTWRSEFYFRRNDGSTRWWKPRRRVSSPFATFRHMLHFQIMSSIVISLIKTFFLLSCRDKPSWDLKLAMEFKNLQRRIISSILTSCNDGCDLLESELRKFTI